jgi:hypothetical protein
MTGASGFVREFGRQMFAIFGATLPGTTRRNVRENRHHSRI